MWTEGVLALALAAALRADGHVPSLDLLCGDDNPGDARPLVAIADVATCDSIGRRDNGPTGAALLGGGRSDATEGRRVVAINGDRNYQTLVDAGAIHGELTSEQHALLEELDERHVDAVAAAFQTLSDAGVDTGVAIPIRGGSVVVWIIL